MRVLLILHALAALTAVGSSLHLGVLGVLLLVKGRAPARLVRIHARVVAVAYAVAFTLGLVMYPSFRLAVRGYYLDRYAPWASNAFDMKEALVLLGIPLVAAIIVVGRRFELPRDDAARVLLGALGVALAAIVVTAAVIGLVVTSVKGPT